MSLHVITSFFVVRALSGAFSPFGGPLAEAATAGSTSSASSPQFLSKVSEAVIERARVSAATVNQHPLHRRSSPEGGETDPAVRAAADRQLEYLHCLLHNLYSPAVRRVLLLVQDAPSADLLSNVMASVPAFAARRDKLVPILFQPRLVQQQQPHYRDLFAVARQLLHPTRDIAAVCNSDIHFNTKQLVDEIPSVAAATRRRGQKDGIGDLVQQGTVLALTRYEECGEEDSFFSAAGVAEPKAGAPTKSIVPTADWWKHPSSHLSPVDLSHAPLIDDYRGSHDAFVFHPAAISDRFLSRVDHPQNAYQSENIVIHEFEMEIQQKDLKSGGDVHKLLNPSKSFFRIAHRHASEVRQWYPPVDGQQQQKRYGRVFPS